MARALATRLPLLAAVALIAAALTDPAVESIANTGVFGGHYADNNHTGVLPTLLGGVILVLGIATVRCLEALRRSADSSGNWLVAVARGFSKRSVARDLPYVFLMQLAALFALESVEQLTVGGKFLGGTAWLGGPILFSLFVHALTGAACTFACASFMRALVRTFASLVRTVIQFIRLAFARASGEGFRLAGRAPACSRSQAPHVRQIGGRAPPLLPTPA